MSDTSLSDIDLLDPDLFQSGEHHAAFTKLRAEGPIHWHEHPDGKGFWSIVGHAALTEINRDPERFSSETGGISIDNHHEAEGEDSIDQRGLNMLYTDPPKHTRYRRLVSKGFTPRMIGLLEQYLTHRSVVIVDNVIERGECDFVDDLAAELPLQAIAEIMGVPNDDRKLLFDWTNTMVGMDDPDYEGDPRAAAMSMYAYSNDLAKKRALDPQDDIITKLINAEIEGDRLNEFEIDMFMLLLAVAGNETTRTATTHGMRALLEHPDQRNLLVGDLDKYLPTAVDEIVRWATPVMHFRRTATVDTEVAGTQMKAGDRIVMWHVSANRDETVWDDPFTFDITREDNPHIGFGAGGAHFCLGANLARMELKLIFNEILTRLPDLAMAGEPEILRSNFIAGVKSMPVSFTPGEKVNPDPYTQKPGEIINQ